MPTAISIDDVMEFLVASSVRDLPPHALADVFDRLIWCQADNGGAIERVRDRWLRGDDAQRIAIALAMSETFPLGGGSAMDAALDSIARRWPGFAARCEEIKQEWRQTVGPPR